MESYGTHNGNRNKKREAGKRKEWKVIKNKRNLYQNFILMAITYPTDMTVTLTVVVFWFMFAMTLSHVSLNVKIYQVHLKVWL